MPLGKDRRQFLEGEVHPAMPGLMTTQSMPGSKQQERDLNATP
jgi:hypothetical protein